MPTLTPGIYRASQDRDFIYEVLPGGGAVAYPTRAGIGPGQGFTPYSGPAPKDLPINYSDFVSQYRPVATSYAGPAAKTIEQATAEFQAGTGRLPYQAGPESRPVVAGGGVSPAPGGLNPAMTSSPTNVEFKNTDAYKALSDEDKSFVDMAFQLIAVGGEQEARFFANAITQAKAIADPYFKSQLTLAMGEIGGKIAELNLDYDTKREILDRTQKELLEDVSAQKEFLTLEQQADIARLTREYDQDILQIRDVAAERGLTFATGARSRVEAERQRGLTFSDVIESSRRRTNFRVRELELKASRGDVAAKKQLEAMTGQRRFGLASLGRVGEAQLGTANLPGIEGYVPTGGVPGEIEERKRKAIISDIGGLVSLQRGFL